MSPRVLATILLVLGACREKPSHVSPAPVAKAPVPATVVLIAPAATTPDAGETPANGANSYEGDLDGWEILADGTLALSTAREIVTVDKNRTVRHGRIPAGMRARLDPLAHGTGIVVEGDKRALLFKSPGLEELYSGVGDALERPHGALVVKGVRTMVVVQVGGALRRFELTRPTHKAVDSVELSAKETFAVVTSSVDGNEGADATIFEVATGRSIGRAMPMTSYGMPPTVTLEGEVQYGIEAGNVVAIDLATAAVRRAKLPCPKTASSMGNPLMNRSGELFVVTCGAEGLLLDPRTFAVKRRYSKILPGCDNGDTLPAHFDAKAPGILVVEGCGGEARLELATGRYRCADAGELVGLPYPGMPAAPGEPPARLPPDRQHLPRCSPDDQNMPTWLGTSHTYRMAEMIRADQIPEVIGPKGTIALEPEAPPPALSLDETMMAYPLKDRVVLRSLPDGAVLLELDRRR